jgi:hypothetical protein
LPREGVVPRRTHDDVSDAVPVDVSRVGDGGAEEVDGVLPLELPQEDGLAGSLGG